MTELNRWTKLIFVDNLVPTTNLFSLEYMIARSNIIRVVRHTDIWSKINIELSSVFSLFIWEQNWDRRSFNTRPKSDLYPHKTESRIRHAGALLTTFPLHITGLRTIFQDLLMLDFIWARPHWGHNCKWWLVWIVCDAWL